MYLLIRHFDGRLQEAVMLSVRQNAMRVALPDTGDATELVLLDRQWVSEDGQPVEIEFMLATAEQEWSRFCDALAAMDEIDIEADLLPAGCFPTPAALGAARN